MGTLDPSLFRTEAIAADTELLNQQLINLLTPMPEWWVTGPQAMRDARARGEGPFPAPVKSPRAREVRIQGKEGPLRLRIVSAQEPRGVYLHIHGGGWVLGGSDQQDLLLERVAGNAGLSCVSVEYRLAPEHPYPAAPDDCETAALWLIENSRKEFGTDLLTIGGESAGAHLSAVTLLRLRDRYGYTGFRAANLVYGIYDLAMTPSQRAFGNQRLILRTKDIVKFCEAFLSHDQDRRAPDVSPLFADLKGMPPALFTVGTRDALLDDSLFMHARWIAAVTGQSWPFTRAALTASPCCRLPWQRRRTREPRRFSGRRAPRTDRRPYSDTRHPANPAEGAVYNHGPWTCPMR